MSILKQHLANVLLHQATLASFNEAFGKFHTWIKPRTIFFLKLEVSIKL